MNGRESPINYLHYLMILVLPNGYIKKQITDRNISSNRFLKAFIISLITLFMVALSTSLFIAESMPEHYLDTPTPMYDVITVSQLLTELQSFVLDAICVAYFTFEYLIRLITCDTNRLRWATRMFDWHVVK